MKEKLKIVAIPLIATLILIGVGAVIVNEIAKSPLPPDGPFIIEGKKVIDYKPQPILFWWTEKMYLYQFNSSYPGDLGWIEVPDFVYNNYTVGDLYPNIWVIYH